MKHTHSTLGLAILGLCFASARAEPAIQELPLKGVVLQGRAFACSRSRFGGVFAHFGPVAGGVETKSPPCAEAETPPLRWQVGRGHFWAVSNGAGDDLERFRLEDLWKGKRITAPGAEDGPDPDGFYFDDYAFLRANDYRPLHHARLLHYCVHFPFRLYYDYLPAAEDEVRLFLLCNVAGADRPPAPPADGIRNTDDFTFDSDSPIYNKPKWTFTVFNFRNEWDAKKKAWKEGTWKREEGIAVDFKEPFQVLGKDDDYYFVTDSGKVYLARKHDKDKDRTIDPAWNENRRPVVAFITDADTNRTFLFCKPDKESGKGVYFELGEDATTPLVEYDARTMPSPTLDGPLTAVRAYAKILLADKKIQDAKPKD